MALGLAVLTISDAGSWGEWADVIRTTDATGVAAPTLAARMRLL